MALQTSVSPRKAAVSVAVPSSFQEVRLEIAPSHGVMHHMVQGLSLAGPVAPLSPYCELPLCSLIPAGRTRCQPVPAPAIHGPACSRFAGRFHWLVLWLREVEQSRVPADWLSSPGVIHWAVGAAWTSRQRQARVRNFLWVNDQLQDRILGTKEKPAPGNGPSRSGPGCAGGWFYRWAPTPTGPGGLSTSLEPERHGLCWDGML